MPLFEYRCSGCKRRFTLLVGMTTEQPELRCAQCGSTDLKKLVSRFSVTRSEEAMLDSLADAAGNSDPDDPRAVAGWMKQMGKEMGEELGDDFGELMDEAYSSDDSGLESVPPTSAGLDEPV